VRASGSGDVSWRLAIGQMGARLGAVSHNLDRCRRAQYDAAARDASLLVLPEAILTGYVFDSRDAARASALAADGAEVAALVDTATELDLHTVVGFIERAGDHTGYRAEGHFDRAGKYRHLDLPRVAFSGDGAVSGARGCGRDRAAHERHQPGPDADRRLGSRPRV
jgi:predicted amidohydrolase